MPNANAENYFWTSLSHFGIEDNERHNLHKEVQIQLVDGIVSLNEVPGLEEAMRERDRDRERQRESKFTPFPHKGTGMNEKHSDSAVEFSNTNKFD